MPCMYGYEEGRTSGIHGHRWDNPDEARTPDGGSTQTTITYSIYKVVKNS